jgi:sporulation protein YlmC with PRC-barrel domain
MRITYHQILGRRVVDRDDRHVGHVVDLIADSHNDHLQVIHLLVGQRALAQRIGCDQWNLHPITVPWTLIAQLDEDHIRLRIPREQLHRDRS